MNLKSGLIGAIFAIATSTTSAAHLDEYGVARFDELEMKAAELIVALNRDRLDMIGNENLFSDFLSEKLGIPAKEEIFAIHVGDLRDEFNFDPFVAEKKYRFKTFILTGCSPEEILFSKKDSKDQALRCNAKYKWGRYIDVQYERDWNNSVREWFEKTDVMPFVCHSAQIGFENPMAMDCKPLNELASIYEPMIMERLLGGVYTGMTIYLDEMLRRNPEIVETLKSPDIIWQEVRSILYDGADIVRKDKKLQKELGDACRKRVKALKLNPKYCKIPRGF